jgi:spore germination protein KC
MKTKWVMRTLLFLVVIVLLTGCWNSRELNDMSIVMAMGVDKLDKTNEYQVSIQVVNPGAVSSGTIGGGSGGSGTPVTVFSGTGKTLFEAIRKTSQKVPRELFFSQMQLLVIGEAAAKDGIEKLFDFFDRGHEIRLTTKVLVTRGAKAKQMMGILAPVEKIPAIGMVGKVEATEKLWSENVNNKIDDIIKALVIEGKEPIISGVIINGNFKEGNKNANLEQTEPSAIVEIKGIALFKNGKLRRWMDGDKARGILLVLNKMKGTIIVLDRNNGKKRVDIEIIRSKTNVSAKVKDDRPIIQIDIRQEGHLGEVTYPVDLTKREEISKLEKEWEKEIEKEVIQAVNIAQREKCDIFGFGGAVKQTNPKAWEKMRKDWSKIFAETKVDVKVDAYIRRTGMRTKPYLSELKE